MSLFGANPFTGTARVESSQPIVGAEQIMYTADTADLRGLADNEAAPGFELNWIERTASSTGSATNWSEVYVHNRDSNSATVTVNYFSNQGLLKASATQVIPANGLKVFSTASLGRLGSPFSGYAKVTQTGNSPLMVSWLEVDNSGTKFYAYQGVPLTQSSAMWACGDVRRVSSSSQYTTLKLVNVDSGPAKVVFNLFDPATGVQKATKPYTLAGGKQLSIVTSIAAFAAVGSSYYGTGIVNSTNGARIIVTASNSYGPGGVTSYTCSSLP